MLHRIFSGLLACLVLFSTMSFVVEKHFCGDTLVDVALFSEANGCGMEMPATIIKSCCKDELSLIKGQDELKFSFSDFDIDNTEVITLVFHRYFNLYKDLPEQAIPFKEYSPPNLFYDRRVLHEVFII